MSIYKKYDCVNILRKSVELIMQKYCDVFLMRFPNIEISIVYRDMDSKDCDITIKDLSLSSTLTYSWIFFVVYTT